MTIIELANELKILIEAGYGDAKAEAEMKERRYKAYLALKEEFENV